MQTDSMSDYVLFILQRQAYCLGLKTVCIHKVTLNYTQVLGERFLTCELRNLFNEIIKLFPK